ncbi:MAG: serine/threonine protein kinase [Myxococcales bacterium]|nr:serine/threonine protein kinase [Myxococcales bacterium]
MQPTDPDGPTQASLAEGDTHPSADRSASLPYRIGEVIGTGGMGEVVLAHDEDLDRDVALKRMRSTAPSQEAVTRFLREAKIQARLDHPAIVPVHQQGRDADGLPYFTMKRVTGTTLAAVLASGEATLQRLLRAFVDVCLAVERAHSRFVVHRDLKPSNIMLGDYGEVYVLDWGVARVLDDGEQEPVSNEDFGPLEDSTRTGQLLGTLGYMAPEQVRNASVGPPVDVYSLGAILFEILCGETLHPRGHAALASTLDGDGEAPSHRRPTRAIAPELDAACTEALAEDPRRRPTARELGNRVQGYLDGDRDVEHRRALAATLVASGRKALEGGDRAQAVHLGGRALALDPDSADAAELVMSLVLEPPDELPPELAASVRVEDLRGVSQRSRRAVLPYLVMFGILVPSALVIGVQSWPLFLALCAMSVVMVGIALRNWRVRPVPVAVTMTAHFITLVLVSQILGSYMITPVVICAVLMSATQLPWVDERPWFVIAWTALATLFPLILEALGVFAPTTRVSSTEVLVHGTVFHHTVGAGLAVIAITNVVSLVVIALYARRIGHDRRMAQHRLQVQAWHLRQLLPRARR